MADRKPSLPRKILRKAAMVLAALLLSQLLRENKQLKDDADLFI